VKGLVTTLEAIVDIEIFIKLAPASVATALASIVLPVPGGPNSRRPLHGCVDRRAYGYKDLLIYFLNHKILCITWSSTTRINIFS